jgi:site-specific DNA-methyltransferase (adenine-specific)
MKNIVTNEDCMELMARYPDKHFELAIVDPPYGLERFKKGGSIINKYGSENGIWNNEKPNEEYFNELFRVSKNQIIWGGNYFNLELTKSWIFWDKGINGDCSFADGELAWTSFNIVLRKANIRYKGFLGADTQRIHPTQKPIKLYEWLLMNYSKEGDKILDTHLGSGSSRIAAYNLGFYFTACELDTEYFEAQEKRFQQHIAQQRLF